MSRVGVVLSLLSLLAFGCAATVAEGKRHGKPAKGTKMTTPMNDQVVLERAREAAGKAVRSPASSVQVEVLGDAQAPGTTPFRAHVNTEEGGRSGYRVGVVTEGETVVDRARAIALVMAAWHYDAHRPVKAREVARVVGFLMSDFAQTTPLLDAKDYEHIREDYRRLIAAPKDITEGGSPGVEFWFEAASDADLGPPLYRAQVLVPASGPATVTVKQISDLIE